MNLRLRGCWCYRWW